jgi:hypothetical protein
MSRTLKRKNPTRPAFETLNVKPSTVRKVKTYEEGNDKATFVRHFGQHEGR